MPTTYSELLPPQKSSPRNGIRWTPCGRGGFLRIMTGRESSLYGVLEYPNPWAGRAFHLIKDDASLTADAYDVYCARDGQDNRCTCPGFRFGRGKPCKHILACLALIENNWIECLSDIEERELGLAEYPEAPLPTDREIEDMARSLGLESVPF